jgi:hypothetical protein
VLIVSLFNEFVCKLGFFWHEWASLKRRSSLAVSSRHVCGSVFGIKLKHTTCFCDTLAQQIIYNLMNE